MRGWALAVCLLPACAGADGDATILTPDATAETRADVAGDLAIDTRAVDASGDAPKDAIFPTEDSGATVDTAPVDTGPPPGPCGVPAGSTATASGSYSSTPDLVIDGKPETYWNSGGYSGWVKITFPSPTRFDRVRIAGLGSPACSETYTLTGHKGGTDLPLGSLTRAVTSAGGWLDPVVEVTRDEYDALTVQIDPAASWIAVGEVVVSDSFAKCP